MRRFGLLFLLFGLAVCASAAPKPAEQSGAGKEGNLKAWEWANFLILAGGLGYLAERRPVLRRALHQDS
jgi:hypothetical protein